MAHHQRISLDQLRVTPDPLTRLKLFIGWARALSKLWPSALALHNDEARLNPREQGLTLVLINLDSIGWNDFVVLRAKPTR
ncbi:hypothetical protein FBY10_10177 [Pseudomonas sp. SJZ103]|nr:hypothetical protein FBY10_10177 [Pseudomonas sp. SJZ103]TWC93484.1 hypothetical protein FBY08_101981 [Pseudomonas sp. SJZ094]